MKQTKLHFLLFAMALLTFASCDDIIDGLQDAMEWKMDVEVVETSVVSSSVEVSAEGGTYKFECTNYVEIWLNHADADGEHFNRKSMEEHIITGEWFDIKVEENVLEVVILPNDDKGRNLKVMTSNRNTSYTFTFMQNGAE